MCVCNHALCVDAVCKLLIVIIFRPWTLTTGEALYQLLISPYQLLSPSHLGTSPPPSEKLNNSRFKEWLNVGSMDTQPNHDVIDLIGYLAYESVREVS